MKVRDFKEGDVVRHFKRELLPNTNSNKYLYKIICFAHHSETDEELVVYKALYEPFKICARPRAMFESKVDKRKYPEIHQEYRFEKVQ